jgi:hypothetical protein
MPASVHDRSKRLGLKAKPKAKKKKASKKKTTKKGY